MSAVKTSEPLKNLHIEIGSSNKNKEAQCKFWPYNNDNKTNVT